MEEVQELLEVYLRKRNYSQILLLLWGAIKLDFPFLKTIEEKRKMTHQWRGITLHKMILLSLIMNFFFPVRAVFVWVSKSNWLNCITMPCHWLKKTHVPFHPIRSKTLARFFLRYVLATCTVHVCIYFEFWSGHWIVCVRCDWLVRVITFNWLWVYNTQ